MPEQGVSASEICVEYYMLHHTFLSCGEWPAGHFQRPSVSHG